MVALRDQPAEECFPRGACVRQRGSDYTHTFLRPRGSSELDTGGGTVMVPSIMVN